MYRATYACRPIIRLYGTDACRLGFDIGRCYVMALGNEDKCASVAPGFNVSVASLVKFLDVPGRRRRISVVIRWKKELPMPVRQEA